MAFPFVFGKKGGNWVKVFLFFSSRSQSTEAIGSRKLMLRPADCSGWFDRLGELLLDSSLHWREWCCSSREDSLSLPLPPSLPLMPPWLHIDVITILTFVVFYATTAWRTVHCRVHGPVYSAFPLYFAMIYVHRDDWGEKMCRKFWKIQLIRQTVRGGSISVTLTHPLHSDRQPVVYIWCLWMMLVHTYSTLNATLQGVDIIPGTPHRSL